MTCMDRQLVTRHRVVYKIPRKRLLILTAVALYALYFYYVMDHSAIGQDKKSSVRPTLHQKIPVLEEDDTDVWLGKDTKNMSAVVKFVEKKMRKSLKWDKGMGCKIPHLDPFSNDTAWTYKKLPPLNCKGLDWVRCYHSKCRVVEKIKKKVYNIHCVYKDIIYKDDFHYKLGKPIKAKDGKYELLDSDHVNVTCTGISRSSGKEVKWSGNTLGLRPVTVPFSPSPTDDPLNVMILAFDSTPRTGFIKLMPKSWKVIKEELNATIMQGYNILGDGTAFALFPILMGKPELELPDVRRSKSNKRTMDDFPILFKKLTEEGYRTAYLEDMPIVGTFQFRFNGFTRQPADHYLRSFRAAHSRLFKGWNFCLGDRPQYRMMMNITEQFLELDGKRFIFTFIADITHGNLNTLQYADDDTAVFLRRMLKRTEDTLIMVMGDHGPRYAAVRKKHSIRGKLDERLPFISIRLPDRLKRTRPDAQTALEANSHVLTTAHDLHATLLDVLGMRRYWNPYKVPGADLKRGLSWLEPIPSNRSCSEAGIETHWCTCLVWNNVSITDPLYNKAAEALIDYINHIIKDAGSKCVPRSISSISWVLRQRSNNRLLSYNKGMDYDKFLGRFDDKTKMTSENFQIGIEVNPGGAVYEATLLYYVKSGTFVVQTRDISRVNAYRGESDCILDSYPHLAPYCYCKR